MYDIKIFLEDNWEFWARVNAWHELIYWIWKNQNELMKNLKQGLELSFENKQKDHNVSKLFSYFNSNKKEKVCH